MADDLYFLFAYSNGEVQSFIISNVYKNFNGGTFYIEGIPRFYPEMKNGGKLKTDNNVYNEACDDGNFDVQTNRQVRGVNQSLFQNDRLSIFSDKAFLIDIVVFHTGT